MPRYEPVALELLEYKVEDLLQGRVTRGGPAAAFALLDRLNRSASLLDDDSRRRLTLLGQQLRTLGEQPKSHADSSHSLDSLVLGGDDATVSDQPPLLTEERPAVRMLQGDQLGAAAAEPVQPAAIDPALTGEQSELQRLATAVWWHELERFMTQAGASLRAERDRYTARLLYATHRNLLRYGAAGDYRTDANLSRFRVHEAIPARDDALVSVDDLDSLVELVREILSTIMELGEPGTVLEGIEISREQSLEFVQRAALAVAADPYAGRTSLIERREPGSRELRLAIQELGREWLPEEERISQRRELEQRLQAVLAFERHERQLFERDVRQFSNLIRTFFEKTARFLPKSVGGEASGPKLQGGVLGGLNPLLALSSVPEGTSAVTVYLGGSGQQFRLAGLELATREQSGVRSISAGGREAPLERHFILETARGKLHGFTEGNYLHLRFEDFGRSLAVLVAEALAAYFVLSSEQREDLLIMLRILANTVVGEPQELVRQALARLTTLSANVPRRRVAIEGFLRGSTRAAGLSLSDSVIQGLVHRFHTAMTVTPGDLSTLLESLPSAEASVYPLSGEPLSVQVGSTSLTVRQYRGRGEAAQESMVVMLPGRTLGSFTDYLIEPLGNGTLICVKGDRELAVIHLKDGAVHERGLVPEGDSAGSD